MALRGVEAQRILVSAVEHPSILQAAHASGAEVDLIPVDSQGVVDLAELGTMIAGANTLVSVMAANNETGVVQPLEKISALAREAGALLHVDAVQAFGKMPVNFGLLSCDMMTVAAHKVGGPKGVGALVVRDGLVVQPLIVGGGQELRRRAGTENVIAIAGFGALAGESLLDTRGLRSALERHVGDALIFGGRAPRLSNTVCFAHPALSAEILMMLFDLDGIAVSSGSACSSGKVGRSHVLEAMGVTPALAASAIRVSLGWDTTANDIARFGEVWRKILDRKGLSKAA
jgi:cysteine desulfurase